MPIPHQLDPPSAPRLLACPDCFKLMRITFIEADDNRERIKFICDNCGTEEILTNSLIGNVSEP
jgi:hypothetical protein